MRSLLQGRFGPAGTKIRISEFETAEALLSKNRTGCQSGSIDCGLAQGGLFNLSSILIYASMTMSERLRGAVGVNSVQLSTCRGIVFADVRGRKGLGARLDFPKHPGPYKRTE